MCGRRVQAGANVHLAAADLLISTDIAQRACREREEMIPRLRIAVGRSRDVRQCRDSPSWSA
eukprot:117904-Rhodomonas_salina.1